MSEPRELASWFGHYENLIDFSLQWMDRNYPMGWQYNQTSGALKKDGIPVGTGYSGHGEGKNNPSRQPVHDVGPIPCGLWEICGPPYISADHGPYVLRLKPLPDTETFGRSGFLMHGDSREHPGEASMGCVVLPREVRAKVWQSGDTRLEVISGL